MVFYTSLDAFVNEIAPPCFCFDRFYAIGKTRFKPHHHHPYSKKFSSKILTYSSKGFKMIDGQYGRIFVYQRAKQYQVDALNATTLFLPLLLPFKSASSAFLMLSL